MFSKRIITLLILSLVILWGGLTTVQAQTGIETRINYAEVIETDEGDEGAALQLAIFFNLMDGTGQVFTDNASSVNNGARIILDDGSEYPAEIIDPDSPFYVALVLDASGSMSPQHIANSMREAATSAVRNAPEEAYFSVVQFDDNVDQLLDFTNDHNQVITTINDITPVDRQGTCLYDGAFQALQNLRNIPSGSRRAIILFTDGKDEVLSGEQCSTHEYNEVVELARESVWPVFINVVGMRTTQLNEEELTNMADSTGGLAVIDDMDNLNASFRTIMDVLSNQWLAVARIFPSAGDHWATLSLNSDGVLPDNIRFHSSRAYTPPPTEMMMQTPPNQSPGILSGNTPPPGATLAPPMIEVDTVQVNREDGVVHIQTITENVEGVITAYRFVFNDASTNNLIWQETLDAPLDNPSAFSLDNLPGGRYTVEISGLDAEGRRLVKSDAKTFTIEEPTPTPNPETEPVELTVGPPSWRDKDTGMLVLTFEMTRRPDVGEIVISLVNDSSGIEEASFRRGNLPEAEIDVSGLPDGRYTISVEARGYENDLLASASQQLMIEWPTPTPTTTPTPTVTPTPTEEGPSVILQDMTVSANEDNTELTFSLTVIGESDVDRYRLSFTDSSGIEEHFEEFEASAGAVLSVEIDKLSGGNYTVEVRALAADDLLLGIIDKNIRITPPATAVPTEEPTPDLTPTAEVSPTPDPGETTGETGQSTVETILEWLRDSQHLPIVIGVVVFILALLALALVRLLRSKPQQEMSDWDAEYTGAVQQDPVENYIPPAASSPYDDPMDKTNPVAHMVLPEAYLQIERSREASLQGQRIPVDHVPFKLGRRGKGDLNFDNDDNVSRSHAEITYRNNVFFITDVGSTHGTFVDDRRISGEEPLTAGCYITLGTTTQLIFDLPGQGFDPDKTNPQAFVPPGR